MNANAVVSLIAVVLFSVGYCSNETFVAGKYFDRIFIIIFENEAHENVILDPYFAQLANSGAHLTNFYAISHPSQPNYVASVAGATLGITNNNNVNLAARSVVDLLQAGSISWKAYMEDYPGNCYTGSFNNGDLYARKHNPFISFNNIRANWCNRIVPATQLDTDIANNQLPQYSYYAPNQDNDGHDTTIPYASNWLKNFLANKMGNPNFSQGTVIVLTYDEDDGGSGNHVYTALIGPRVRPGRTDATQYSLYSLVSTVTDNWGLGNLGRNDTTALPFAAANYV